ncbi:hypothetical protein [Elizabethkingia sp. HX XZB]|uniref:hypothetical protein n=1 Tax=Elizabethkingia sp. HX XZB TaxID=3003193 RepID=UPI002A23C1B0|nr:hypothetical protein [Elizabethkingia sp. HX XZB]
MEVNQKRILCMIVDYIGLIDDIIVINILIFLLFFVFVFTWYKFFGEEYSVKYEENCKEVIRNDCFFININQLAKNNSPYFLISFQQLYPEFCNKLLKIDNTFKTSEFRFFAYLYLGYTTTEVAEYTRVTEESVLNIQTHLRKKLKLSSEQDLNLWIKKI